MSVFESTKFKKLRAKWEQKLIKSGFRDIENARGDLIDHRSTQDTWRRINGSKEVLDAAQEYYYWAGGMVSRGKFQSTLDKKIWKLHAEGFSSRRIAEDVPLKQWAICKRIRRIRDYLILQHSESKD